ncbi:hypothetical protein FKN04_12405 [Bacillus glycinifermentans]|uniref:hypothetical protein n=1 Tax=Bacillus glycinifermentans TaxID=1664069 RepID=UPI001581BB28|nr:hypothetical protein [Bacillus glycinifermentans]NUJ17382.1 hypothetical protein [Bacillus glycinifermentans]
MTNLAEVYDSFLSKITDYRLSKMTEEEIKEDLFGYFKSARAKFYKCKKDLTVIDEVIQSDLSDIEIEILVSLMLVEHIKPQLLSSENLKQSLSDKDFKIYSQANQLRETRLLFDNLKREVNKMITEYTFLGIDEEKMK